MLGGGRVSSMGREALALAALGYRVFPLRVRGKEPLIPKSAGGNGCHDATTDPDQIRAWWAKTPAANIGVHCGAGFIVIDVDGPEGRHTLRELCSEHRVATLPRTRVVTTGREGGGHHLYYSTADANLKQANNGLGPHLDVRYDGYYVVAPGSIHPSTGRAYKANDVPMATLPCWLADLLRPTPMAPKAPPAPRRTSDQTSKYGKRILEDELRSVREAPEGTRQERLYYASQALARIFAGGELAARDDPRSDLAAAAAHAGLRPFQIEDAIRRAWERGLENPKAAPKANLQPPRQARHSVPQARSTR